MVLRAWSGSESAEKKGLEARVCQAKRTHFRDANKGTVVDVTAQLPLGGEGDLVPGDALPAELVHERLHLGEEGRRWGGVPVLDGPSFAKEGIGGVQVGARESFRHAFP